MINIKTRVLKEAIYMKESKETIRNIAKVFKVSKSTVHKDLTERLKIISHDLYNEIRDILNYHLEIRHINGGEKTRLKYKGA